MSKKTFQPTKKKRAKTTGFFARKDSKVLKTRRAKGRKKICN